MKRQTTKYIVFHCSATRPSMDIGAAEIRKWHVEDMKWADIGYHLIIRRDGRIEAGRPLDDVGSHVAGHNHHSVACCMVGGLDTQGKGFNSRPDLFTPQQWESAELVAKLLHRMYPGAQILGHRDLSPDKDGDGTVEQHEWLKTCPGFNAFTELGDVLL